MSSELRERRLWEQAKEALMNAVRAGDAKKVAASVKKIRLGPTVGHGAQRAELFEKALHTAISRRGESAAAVCEALMSDGIGPGLGWRRALSAWQFANNEQEAAQSRSVAEALMRAGATAEWEDGWPAISGESESPLWSVCHYPNGQPERSWEMAHFLVERGANPNHINGAGESALWGCCSGMGRIQGLAEREAFR